MKKLNSTLRQKIEGFIASFFERKIVLSLYTIFEKWFLLHLIVSNQLILTQDILILIFGKDIVLLVIIGLISIEKIKISIDK